MSEWEVIQEILLKVDNHMKLHIKEQLRKIAYPKTKNLKPLTNMVKTKVAPTKFKQT